MNSVRKRWIQTCRRELLDRALIWNRSHLLHAPREFEYFYNGIHLTGRLVTPRRYAHYPHRSMIRARNAKVLVAAM
jgi:hypothetical protein